MFAVGIEVVDEGVAGVGWGGSTGTAGLATPC